MRGPRSSAAAWGQGAQTHWGGVPALSPTRAPPTRASLVNPTPCSPSAIPSSMGTPTPHTPPSLCHPQQHRHPMAPRTPSLALTRSADCSTLLLRVAFLSRSLASRAPSSLAPKCRGSAAPNRLHAEGGAAELGPLGPAARRLSLGFAFSFFLLPPSSQPPALRRAGTFSSLPAPGLPGRRLIFTSPSGLPRRHGPGGGGGTGISSVQHHSGVPQTPSSPSAVT